MNPILRWPGSKRRHLKTLLPLIPEHVCYVEPFAGGLAVLLGKEPSPVEVVNDVHRDIVALYRCAQFHHKALCSEVELIVSARVNFADFKVNRGLTDLQRAARFLMLNRSSFAGDCHSFAVQRKGGGGSTFSRKQVREMIDQLNARMDRVVVECLDWQRCVELYDSEDTFFFVDPPYFGCDIHAYDGFDQEQMTRLREVLRKIKGRWLLTVDGSEFCRELFKEWNCREVTTRNGAVNNGRVRGKTFSELFITRE